MNFKKVFALSAAAVLALSMTACGNKDDDEDDEENTPDYEVPVEAFIDNITDFDADDLKKDLFFDEEIKYQVENNCNGDESMLDERLEDMFASIDDDFKYEFDNDYKLSYKVVEKEKCTESELDYLNDDYGKYFDDEDFEVDGGYILEVEINVKSDSSTYVSTWEFAVVEIDGEWGLNDWYDDWDFEEKSFNDDFDMPKPDEKKSTKKVTTTVIRAEIADVDY